MSETNWLPGLLVLVGGVIAGLVAVALAGRRAQAAKTESRPADAELDERYRSKLNQLRELASERHLLGEERFAVEKARLESEAVALLREQTEQRAKPGPATPAAAASHGLPSTTPDAASTKSGAKAMLWVLAGLGAVAFFVMVGLLLSRETKPRTDDSMAMGGPGQPPPDEDPGLGALERQLADRPDDVELLSALAHEYIARERFEEAARLIDRAIALDPFHVETRTHRALLVATQGDMAKALAELEHLAQVYPGTHEARLYAGVLAMQLGDNERALEYLERYRAETPERVPPMLGHTIEKLRASRAPKP